MGSTSWTIDSNVTGREEALRYAHETLWPNTRIIDHAYGSGDGHGTKSYGWGGVLYVLVESEEHGQRKVEALIYLFSVYKDRGYREFVTKTLSETMGPGRIDCPKRFLSKLTPTTNEYALEWRAQVERFHSRRAEARKAIGSVIELPRPLTYGDPIGEVTTVRVTGLTSWSPVGVPGRYRLRPPRHWWMSDYTTVSAA